jgi:hypothetical protein
MIKLFWKLVKLSLLSAFIYQWFTNETFQKFVKENILTLSWMAAIVYLISKIQKVSRPLTFSPRIFNHYNKQKVDEVIINDEIKTFFERTPPANMKFLREYNKDLDL